MKKSLLIWIAVMVVGSAYAQPTVLAELDTTRILIGDHVRLSLFINYTPDVAIQQVDLSVLAPEDDLELLKVGGVDTIKGTNETILEQELIVTAFDSGYYWIPKIPVRYEKQGIQSTVYTNELPLTVMTIPINNDSTNLAPIKNIIKEPLRLEDGLPYIVGLILLILVALLVWYYFRKPKEEVEQLQPAVVKPAHEIALEQLANLKAAQLWQQGAVKKYHTDLTYILREYLEKRFHISARESTSDQILRQLKQIGIVQEWQKRLGKLLQAADLVKFAKAKPPASLHEEVMDQVEQFIHATKKVEPVATPDAS